MESSVPVDVIVGANSSLGKHYVNNLPWQSHTVLATFHSSQPQFLPGIQWRRCDLSSKTDIDNLIGEILSFERPLRIAWFPGTLSKDAQGPPEWSDLTKVFNVNAVSVAYFVGNVTERLIEGSRVALCSSISALKGSFDLPYSSSKASIGGIVMSSVRLCQRNVSVFAIAPNTVVDSSMFASFSPQTKLLHQSRSRNGLLTRSMVSSRIYQLMNSSAEETNGKVFSIGVD